MKKKYKKSFSVSGHLSRNLVRSNSNVRSPHICHTIRREISRCRISVILREIALPIVAVYARAV